MQYLRHPEDKVLATWIALFYDTPIHSLLWFYNFLFYTRTCDDLTMTTTCREWFVKWANGDRSHQGFYWCWFLLCFPGAAAQHDVAVQNDKYHLPRYYCYEAGTDSNGWSVGGHSAEFNNFQVLTRVFRHRQQEVESHHEPSLQFVRDAVFHATAAIFSPKEKTIETISTLLLHMTKASNERTNTHGKN